MYEVGICMANGNMRLPEWLAENCKKNNCPHFKEMDYGTAILVLPEK
jgi:hypothetical protein